MGDWPYLLQQRLRAARLWYASSSLFTKNVVFVFVGASLGYVIGKIERKRRLAEGDLNRNVRVTFFSLLPPATDTSPSSPSIVRDEGEKKNFSDDASLSHPTKETRRSFEALWNHSARSLQRLPGYGWTQMYRLSREQPHAFYSSSSSSSLSSSSLQSQPQDVGAVQGVLKRPISSNSNHASPSSQRDSSCPSTSPSTEESKGISGSVEEAAMPQRGEGEKEMDETSRGHHRTHRETERVPGRPFHQDRLRADQLPPPPPPDYVQLRQWLNDEEPQEHVERTGVSLSQDSTREGGGSRRERREGESSMMQTADSCVARQPGGGMGAFSSKKEGLYEIIVDDSLVRIIQ